MSGFDDIIAPKFGISPKPFAVTPSNSTNFSVPSRYFYVGGAGVVKLVRMDDVEVSFTVPAGGYIFACAKRVNQTDTTATLIVGHE